MPPIKKYRIARVNVEQNVEWEEVFADQLSYGWQPWGTPNIFRHDNGEITVYQIFVKYEE